MYTLVMSETGIPSVIATITFIPASAASKIASAAKSAGTNIIEVFALVFNTAWETVLKNSKIKKPVVGFIAGETAPKGRTMGHAGAIVGGKDDTAEAKKKILRDSGVNVVDSPADIGLTVKQILN